MLKHQRWRPQDDERVSQWTNTCRFLTAHVSKTNAKLHDNMITVLTRTCLDEKEQDRDRAILDEMMILVIPASVGFDGKVSDTLHIS